MLTINVQSGQVSAALAQLAQRTNRPRELLQAAAISVRRDLQRHFRDRDKQPNALGGKRTHWWARVARATNISSVTDAGAEITISEPGLGIKLSGGTIVPKEAKALTIPIHSEAYGRRAATVEMATGQKLFRVRLGKVGLTFLARRHGDGIRLLYVLKASVRVPRDPDAIPPAAKLEQTAVAAAEAQLNTYLPRR